MVSSLFGYFNAVRSLQVNQAALSVINNNIANMNTDGYSKQRLDLSANVLNTDNTDMLALAQSGAGANIDDISRNRDSFLDNYYREESSKNEYSNEYASNAALVENMSNELGSTGLSTSFSDFYTALNKLSSDASNSVLRNSVITKATDLCTKFNQVSAQLTSLRTSITGDVSDPGTITSSKISTTCTDLNAQLKSLADINHSIALTTSQGGSPNGLLDQRDMILDNISKVIPIDISTDKGNLTTIKYNGVTLVSGTSQSCSFSVKAGTDANPAIVQIKDTNGNVINADLKASNPTGSLGAMLDLASSDSDKLTIKGLLNNLDNLASNFASQMNTVQEGGQYIDSSTNKLALVTNNPATPATPPFDIFVNSASVNQPTAAITAGNITISNNIVNDSNKLAMANSATTVVLGVTTITDPTAIGDGNNALTMIGCRNKSIAALDNCTTEGYLNSVSGKMGVNIESVTSKQTVQNAVVAQIQAKRDSTSGVSLDEELSDLVRFQRAYEASAKVFNTMDSILQSAIALAK